MKKTLTSTLIAALAAPSFAGGPVVVAEEPEVVAERPTSAKGPIVPLLVLLAAGVLVVGLSDDGNADDNTSSS